MPDGTTLIFLWPYISILSVLPQRGEGAGWTLATKFLGVVMRKEPGAHSSKTKRHSKGVRGEEVGRSVLGTGMVGWSDGLAWIGTEPGMVGSGGGVIPLPTGHYHNFEEVSCLIRALLRPLASSKPKKGTKNQNTRRRTKKRGKGAPPLSGLGAEGPLEGPGDRGTPLCRGTF